jgi:RimJ/RimL family protein N-acetyltransferase
VSADPGPARVQRPSLDDVRWPLHTARLTLRRGRPEDAEGVFAFRRLEAVSRWLTRVQTDPFAWAREWNERVTSTIVVECDGALIGDTRVVIRDAHAQGEVADRAVGVEAELMWAFHPDWTGRGYATEAIEGLVRIAFTELGLRRLVALCFADNEPSWRLMERVGMRREGHDVAATLHRDGTWCDFLHYALLPSDVPSQDARAAS